MGARGVEDALLPLWTGGGELDGFGLGAMLLARLLAKPVGALPEPLPLPAVGATVRAALLLSSLFESWCPNIVPPMLFGFYLFNSNLRLVMLYIVSNIP